MYFEQSCRDQGHTPLPFNRVCWPVLLSIASGVVLIQEEAPAEEEAEAEGGDEEEEEEEEEEEDMVVSNLIEVSELRRFKGYKGPLASGVTFNHVWLIVE